MPQYEYFCHNCKKAFSNILEQAEHQESITCPHCGSRKLEQQVSPFYAVTPKKSRRQNDDSRERVNLSASEEDDRARVISDWEGAQVDVSIEADTDATLKKPKGSN